MKGARANAANLWNGSELEVKTVRGFGAEVTPVAVAVRLPGRALGLALGFGE